jgi:uncharacterized membrane protein YfcA
LEALDLAILAAAAFATSILSAVVGMAGGITLLAVMLLFLEPLAAIPLHGVIQLVSNSSRTVIQRRHLDLRILLHYSALLVPMGWVGLHLANALPAAATRVIIGIFVLIATWFPGWLMLGTHPEETHPGRRFIVLGGVAGVLNMTIGAIGPLIAPFFLNLGLERRALVGTKAACQTLGHLVKIALFGVAGFAFGSHLVLLVTAGACVVAGTWLGSRILERVSERFFRRLYMGVLTAIALRLLVGEAFALHLSR